MKLSREKVVHLSHLILNQLNHDEEVEFFADPQEIRQQIFYIIGEEVKSGEAIDAAVRRKLETQKRVVEGSEEWEILYRKYYEEEQNRHRKLMP
jgi:hypothetical protein